MSYRVERYLSLPKIDQDNYLKDKTEQDKRDLFLEILHDGMHGLCFSIYEDGQKPGDIVPISQVRRRMQIIKNHTQWVRSFSCVDGNEHVPVVAKEMGIKTLVGAWLGNDLDKNEKELEALIKLAKEGLVDIAAVGNEVMYRKDLSEEELIAYIRRFKDEVPEVPVGYVDAYYEFSARPKITAACDVILANCYPFWESCPFDSSLSYLKEMFRKAKEAAGGKRVIVSETGWPSQGESLDGAVPSMENSLDYFVNTQLWAMDENIECFYFSSFDENWKKSSEGEVGAYWGIWDKDEKLKF